jgi:hypothetical protein
MGAIPPLPNTPSWHGAQLKKSTMATLPLPLVTNQNCIHEEIKSRLRWRNANSSVQNVLLFHLLSKILKVKIYKLEFYLLIHMGVKLDLSL